MTNSSPAGAPFAATGRRIVATLVKLPHAQALDTERLATELISVCVAGGQGAVSGDASYGAVVW